MPVPASGWLTSGASGWSVGVSPLKNRPVELTPVLGMEAAKLTAALWWIPLEPRPKPCSPCAAGPGGVVVVKASNVPLPVDRIRSPLDATDGAAPACHTAPKSPFGSVLKTVTIFDVLASKPTSQPWYESKSPCEPKPAKTTPSGCPGTLVSSTRPGRLFSRSALNATTPLADPAPVPGTETGVLLVKLPSGLSVVSPTVTGPPAFSRPLMRFRAWNCVT